MGQKIASCCSPNGGLPKSGRSISAYEVTAMADSQDIHSPRRGIERRGNKQRIQQGTEVEAANAEAYLSKFKQPRVKDPREHQLIKCAMSQDSICNQLAQEELDMIVDTMEFYEFDAHTTIVEQGKPGTTFFVMKEGTCEVTMNGAQCNQLGPDPTAFGGIALLYNCPRTASVKALQKCSMWGCSGATFQHILMENSKKHYQNHRQILDRIPLFNGLTSKQKDSVAEACYTEVFQERARVVTQGESAPVIYFVKTGSLSVYIGGTVTPSGELRDATLASTLGPGDCFGERAVLMKDTRTGTVISAGKSELVCVSAAGLQDVLGDELSACLERNYILTGFKQSSRMNEFNATQKVAFLNVMEKHSLDAGANIGNGYQFIVILDGSVSGFAGEKPMTWEKGMYCEPVASGSGTATKLVAGPQGARLSVLTANSFTKKVQEFGLSTAGNAEEAQDRLQKMVLVKRVPIFRHLSQEQTLKLVTGLKPSLFKKGDFVFQQGDMGTSFYVIANGEVSVKIDGEVKRNLGKNATFGDRALLFDEPRSASIQVNTNECELWTIDKDAFKQMLNKNMQEELTLRIRLQDTSLSLKDVKQVKVVGTGATGVVRMVEHKQTKTRYALKRVQKQGGKVPEEVKRECDVLAENDHPFIMKLVKTYETPKSIYILTELITGGELHGAIRVIPTVLSRVQAQFYTGSLVIVLEELAGRNIVYRDLKPENVMLDGQGYLKLIDFGIARKLEEGKNRTFTMVGTPHYMAPEVMRGQGYGTAVDLWSLGVIQFEFVCGYLPFADELDDPTEVCAAVLKAALTFPSRYRDAAGKSVMQGLLCRQPKKRLGAGAKGYEDVRSHDYFKDPKDPESETRLFDRIMGRELQPPLVPKGETYCDPEDAANVVLSDNDVLG